MLSNLFRDDLINFIYKIQNMKIWSRHMKHNMWCWIQYIVYLWFANICFWRRYNLWSTNYPPSLLWKRIYQLMNNAINISKYKNYFLNFKTEAEKTFKTFFKKGKIIFTKYLQEYILRLHSVLQRCNLQFSNFLADVEKCNL